MKRPPKEVLAGKGPGDPAVSSKEPSSSAAPPRTAAIEPPEPPPAGGAEIEDLATASPGAGAAGGETWFRRLTFFGLLAGLCPLIPLPFLDDWVLSRVRLRMGREILAVRNLETSREDLRTLAGVEPPDFFRGCLSTVFLLPLVKLAIYLARKVFRKIVLILTLKECSDRFSQAFHEGFLLHGATLRGDLGTSGMVPASTVEAVRQGIVRACEEVDPRPIHQLVKRGLRGSRWLLLAGSRRLAALFRRGKKDPDATEAGLEGEERLLAAVVDRLAASLWLQERYWRELEGRYLRAVEDRRRGPAREIAAERG